MSERYFKISESDISKIKSLIEPIVITNFSDFGKLVKVESTINSLQEIKQPKERYFTVFFRFSSNDEKGSRFISFPSESYPSGAEILSDIKLKMLQDFGVRCGVSITNIIEHKSEDDYLSFTKK